MLENDATVFTENMKIIKFSTKQQNIIPNIQI